MFHKASQSKHKKKPANAKKHSGGKSDSSKRNHVWTGFTGFTTIFNRLKELNWSKESLIYLIILTGISLIVLLGPFYRGLFFEREMLMVHVITFSLFTLWWLARLWMRDGSLFKTPLDYAIAALLFFYAISFLGAADQREALLFLM